MRRVILFLGVLALALAAVACGGGSDGGNGGNTDNGGNGGNGGGAAATEITITVTDTGVTVDNATLKAGALVVNVVNQSTVARSVYLISLDRPIDQIPITASDRVDVVSPTPKGVKQHANLENVPPGGQLRKNAVAQAGPALAFSNAPGDFKAGFYKEVTIVP
jgi:hypothetical protein